MRKSFIAVLTGFGVGVMSRPFLERLAPAMFEQCERKMAELTECKCPCHTESQTTRQEESEEIPPVSEAV